MRDFSVGIPVVNNHDLLVESINAVLDSTVSPSRIVIIDNGDIQPFSPHPAWTKEHQIHIVRPQNNIGCAASWNLLHKLIYPHTAIIMNDDCTVALDTLERMMSYDAPQVICAWGFSCFRIDNEIWQRVGDFDEGFYPVYFEDCDYKRRLKLAGIPWIDWKISTIDRNGRNISDETHITHGKTQSYQKWEGDKLKWFQDRLEKNHQRYLAKWGGEPGQETFTVPFNGKADPGRS